MRRGFGGRRFVSRRFKSEGEDEYNLSWYLAPHAATSAIFVGILLWLAGGFFRGLGFICIVIAAFFIILTYVFYRD